MTRLIFFGMTGLFSKIPFDHLLEGGANICAVIVPSEGSNRAALPRRVEPPQPQAGDLPLLTPYLQESIVHRAWAGSIPVWEVGNLRDRRTLALLAGFRADLICVVCFPYIFPKALLDLPQHGCVNLHPSLLPAYRGPTPLFWICRQGERHSGVTLHFLDEGVDSGDIIAQAGFDLPEGMTEMELTTLCAEQGAKLLVDALKRLEAGALPRRPQPKKGTSHYPAPSPADLRIPTDWPARRAFNFLRGADGWPLSVEVGEQVFIVEVALGYTENQTLPEAFVRQREEMLFRFSPGVLRVKVK
jgi:methionyl-tRNA formyltransferase